MKTNEKEQKRCDEFNQKYPVGTRVRYWTGLREGEGRVGKTRSAAEVLSGHTAVVWVEGCRGCVALTHVELDVEA